MRKNGEKVKFGGWRGAQLEKRNVMGPK